MLAYTYLLRLWSSHWTKTVRLTKWSRYSQKLLIQCDEGTSGCTFTPTTKYLSSNVTSLTTKLIDHKRLRKCINQFCFEYRFKTLCEEHNLNVTLLFEALASFRQYCLTSEDLPVELHGALKELTAKEYGPVKANILFPHFLNYYKQEFPNYYYDDNLKKLADLRGPGDWYPKARQKKRKIIFHAGPTNSGKTYNAMRRFLTAKSGIYCSPLKLLANEIYQNSNNLSTPCDLVTGDKRHFANADRTPSSHMACTIEMAPLDREFEVAIIDEIQFIRDRQRGRAWVRAILGLWADEIHLCGEAVAIDLLTRICESVGETVEVRTYERLTKFLREEKALQTLDNVQPGDCIVCFRRSDIYYVSRKLESKGTEVAVLYGALPPEVKLAHAAKFNDPKDPCKVMVATDAIGTGLNLCIKRIIFYSMKKISVNEFGEKETTPLSVSSTLQIAGRAGRYGSQFEHGFVTTYYDADMPRLQSLLAQEPEPIPRAGLAPTIFQLKKYAEELPDLPFSRVLDFFESHVAVNTDLYFVCDIDVIKRRAELIDDIELKIDDRYTFCCAPININHKLNQQIFVEFVEQFSKNEIIDTDWIHSGCGYPFDTPGTIEELEHCEIVFEICNCYLWLSFRFPLNFTVADKIRECQSELNVLIRKGVLEIKKEKKNPCDQRIAS